ncbi:hypothetical protein LSCM1_04487 [Leishmania martiniquensis]|uniref:Uncharacterized protein n=1 Tax=Leishmania martiniquensis TaxID=1580590 RepID=A0A836H266_9TRYP|nr:hypothetical protein LSCM1_04487 [Leishmania martiniquensis]
MCIAAVDRHPASPRWATGVGAGASLAACPVRSSSTKRGGGSAAGLRHLPGSPKARVFSKAVHQLTAAQRAHFTHLRGLLHRLSSIRQPPGEAAVAAARAREAYPQLDTEEGSVLQPLQRCTSTQHGHALDGELFVMSRVIASTHHHALPAEGNAATCGDEVFTGVNHAFHKRVNFPGETLRGILKGCAEQNALGAAAASGCNYADVADVFLLASRASHGASDQEVGPEKEMHGLAPVTRSSCSTACSTAGLEAAQAVTIFPCPECWHHLCHVARARLQQEQPPLRLFVYAASPDVTLQLFTVAQERIKSMEAPMDVCIVSG